MSLMKKGKGLAALIALVLTLNPIATSWGAVSLEGQSFVDSLKFGGDLRLRHDWMDNPGGGRSDRNRERFRLRLGVESTMQDLTAVLRLGSSSASNPAAAAPSTGVAGAGSQTSANQTEGNGFADKPIFIDLAYLQYKVTSDLKIIGGRMPNPFYQLYASDSMWDPDLNPEGYAQKFDKSINDRVGLFVNTAQLPVNEISASETDPWIFGEQVGARATFFDETKLTTALADYGFTNEKANAFGVSDFKYGNSLTAGGVERSAFNIVQFTGELALHAGPLPLSLQGDFVTNTREETGKGRNGYQTGFIAGKASSAKTWEVAYFYKYLQANATISNFADDDFGNGGTNRAGHIFWIAYSPRDYVQIKLKYYVTRVLDRTLSNTAWNPYYNSTFDQNLNRLFLDVMVKF